MFLNKRMVFPSLVFVLLTWNATADVYISELLASNGSGIQDEDGDTSDWLELHNDGDNLVDLANWSLQDGGKNKRTWNFPSLSIQPDGYLLVFASGKDRKSGTLHTDFELKRSGETITLRDARGTIVDTTNYPSQYTDMAWGTHSNDVRYLFPTTPGASNQSAKAYEGVLPKPELSHTGSWFDSPISVSILNIPAETEVRYTIDGTAPNVDTLSTNKQPILITKSTPLRVAFHKPGWLSRETTTATFLRHADVLNQSRPSTYPEFWHEELRGDYAMDSTLLDSDEERERLAEAMKALPTMSVVFDPDALFDSDTGIYLHPEKDGPDWERAASIEWIDESPSNSFQIDAGIQTQGRSSRQPRTSPKHSFRVVFKNKYGPGKLNHPVFENDDDKAEHNTLVLRATSNHSWTYPVAEQRQRAQYLRDPWVKATQAAMGHVAPRSRFVHLFLNGLYWGVYAVSERPDDAFMATHFGGKRSEYDVIKVADVIEGDDRAWKRLFALTNQGFEDEAHYQHFTELVDMDSFIDFMILNHFIGNETWDFGNWYAARKRSNEGRFQFFCWDTETSMNRVNENVVFTRNANRPTALFQALRENAAFRAHFDERVKRHMTGNGVLTPERTIRRYQELASILETPLFAESVRWGDYRLTVHPYRTEPFERYTVDEHWERERRRLTELYFPARTEILMEQYRAIGLIK